MSPTRRKPINNIPLRTYKDYISILLLLLLLLLLTLLVLSLRYILIVILIGILKEVLLWTLRVYSLSDIPLIVLD